MDRLYVPMFGTTSTLLPAMASEKTSGLYPNTPNSRETVPAKSASLYSSFDISDNPPLAATRINTWSSKKFVLFNAIFIPFFKTTSVTSEIGCVRVDAIAVEPSFNGCGSAIKRSGTKNVSKFSSISPFRSFSATLFTASRKSSSLVFFRPSCNRIMQLFDTLTFCAY